MSRLPDKLLNELCHFFLELFPFAILGIFISSARYLDNYLNLVS